MNETVFGKKPILNQEEVNELLSNISPLEEEEPDQLKLAMEAPVQEEEFDQEEIDANLKEEQELQAMRETGIREEAAEQQEPSAAFSFPPQEFKDFDMFKEGYAHAAIRRTQASYMKLPLQDIWLLGYISGLHERLADLERLFVGKK